MEHQAAQLAVTSGRLDHPVVLAAEVAPRLVGGEEHPVSADASLVDLAKKPIVPPTAVEILLSGHMKTVNSAMGVIRGGLEKPDAAQMKEQVAALKKAFTDAEGIFKTRGMATAITWAGDALKFVNQMEQGVNTAKWDDVKAAAGGLQPLCAQCHNEHRERMDDGSYRIKGG